MTNFPSIRRPSQVTCGHKTKHQRHVSPLTYTEQIREIPDYRLHYSISYPKLSETDSRVLSAFIASLKVNIEVFEIPMFHISRNRGAPTGIGAVDGAGQLGKTLQTNGWGTSITNLFSVGDCFNLIINGRYHLYQVTEDVSSDSSGNATLKISPPMIIAPPNGALVYYNASELKLSVRIDDSEYSVLYTPPVRGAITLNMTQVLL